jgi:hypothetical protein
MQSVLSPPMLGVRIPLIVRGTLWQVGGFLHFSPVSSTNKTDCYDIIEILLKVALNTITLTLTV